MPDRVGIEPRATYRLQVRDGVTLDDAVTLVPYLADLGVSHLYLAPILRAAPGSTHGYDIVDPTIVDPEIGGGEALQRLHAALRDAGLGLVLDIVPNHMAADAAANPWWRDVLEDGARSPAAALFDVDWDGPDDKGRGTVLLPILGDHYGTVLEKGELQLGLRGGRPVVRYYEHDFPLSSESVATLLDRADDAALAAVARSLERLPVDATGRHAAKRDAFAALDAALADEGRRAALERVLAAVSGDHDALHEVLESQHYRLALWRTARYELDYRRFFDVHTLIGVRMEDPGVFDVCHRAIRDLVAAGVVDGLRVDHPDGLADPKGYLERLAAMQGDGWLVVEKILEGDEPLDETWPVAGTTGYDALNVLGGLFVDPAGGASIHQAWSRFTGDDATFEEVALSSRRDVLRGSLASEVRRLVDRLERITSVDRRYRDLTRLDLDAAVLEVLVRLDVYRTYVRVGPDGADVSARDHALIERTLDTTRLEQPELDPLALEVLDGLLHGRHRSADAAAFVHRFQQVSSAAMAKGVEDTAFYRYGALLCLNEVGGDPARFGVRPDEFHEWCRGRQTSWPLAMNATSTHDTKRSEDVRACLSLLSEMPAEWASLVGGWSELASGHRAGDAPSRCFEWQLWQTLVAAHPLPVERALAWAEKSVREAKQETSWTAPDQAYEAAVRRFVERVVGDPTIAPLLAQVRARLDRPAWETALAQKLLALTVPGVPDVYQGTELWDLSLVDPDNRRAVDFGSRRALLAPPEGPPGLDGSGAAKFHVVRHALAVRRRRPEAFGAAGTYEALSVHGPLAAHAVAFVRSGAVATVVPRLVLGRDAAGGWDGETAVELPAGTWTDVLTGRSAAGRVALAELLAAFPVALLERTA